MQLDIILVTIEIAIKHKSEILNLQRQLLQGEVYDTVEYRESKYKDMFRFLNNETAIVAGAMVGNKLIGYIWGYKRKTLGEIRMHITQFVVDDEYRGQGIGRQLMRYMQRYSEIMGWVGIELNVGKENDRARKFYQDNGFECERMLLFRKNDNSVI